MVNICLFIVTVKNNLSRVTIAVTKRQTSLPPLRWDASVFCPTYTGDGSCSCHRYNAGAEAFGPAKEETPDYLPSHDTTDIINPGPVCYRGIGHRRCESPRPGRRRVGFVCPAYIITELHTD